VRLSEVFIAPLRRCNTRYSIMVSMCVKMVMEAEECGPQDTPKAYTGYLCFK
jgi:hypothetical protein